MTVTWTSGYNINEAEPVGKINTWIQIKKKNTMHAFKFKEVNLRTNY